MRRQLLFSSFLVVCLLAVATVLLVGAQNRGDRVRVYVEFDRFTPQAVALVRGAGGTVHHQFPQLSAVAATLPQAAVQGLLRNPKVIAMEDDPIRVPLAQTTPYGITMVEANQVVYNDPNAADHGSRKVCIIDSGYYLSHEDLPVGTVAGFSGTGNWDQDLCGHGTHVAGTIAALNNAKGVVGVFPSGDINLHIVKVFGDSCTWAYSSDLIAAADKCVKGGVNANVISMSLGGSFRSRFEQKAFDGHNKNGVLSVAAAGNNGTTQKSYPASYNSVVSVAAIDADKVVADFSQKNSQVELAAPGVGVLSTVPWNETNTLTVGGVTYNGNHMENAARGSASGALADGVICDSTGAWGGKVVLCERGSISFYDKVMNVESSGGAAAVIYNNAPGNFFGTLGSGNISGIPAISLSQQDGQIVVALLGQATVVSNRTEPASGYEAWDGTSMATPHVSGVAALVWSNHEQCTNSEIRETLQATAEDLGDLGRDNAYGFGLVRAKAALDLIDANGCSISGGGGGGGGCDLLPVGASCTSNSECCSNKCKGKPGNKTCK
jgi:subtilisin family serine protease